MFYAFINLEPVKRLEGKRKYRS